MSIEKDIADAFAIRAEAIATALDLYILFPNLPDNHPENARWLEVRHIRNTNLNPTWGDEKTLLGVYQISIMDPFQEGEVPSTVIGSQIIDAFGKNSVLTSGSARVVIYENPTLLTTVQMPEKSAYPVSIPYRCFKA